MSRKTLSPTGYRRCITHLLAVAALVLLPIFALHGQDREEAARTAEEAGKFDEAFELYLAAFQALPEPPPLEADMRLRERIIKLAVRLDPPPEMPEEADRYATRAKVMFQMAEKPSDYTEAAAEFRKAVRAAPWVPHLAFNLALVEEKLNRFDAAITNVKRYLSSEPPDADDARAKLYEFEYLKERAEERAAAAVPAHLWIYAKIPSGAQPEIYINGVDVVHMDNRRYLMVRLKSGSHTIKAGKEALESFEVAAGKEYFVRLRNVAGRWTSFSLEWGLEFMKQEEALSEMKKMKPIDKKYVKHPAWVSLARIQ